MNKFLLSLFMFLFLTGNSWAAILVFSPNGTYTTKTTLASANTAADALGKRIKLTGPVTMTANVTLATDRQWDFTDTVITTTGYTLTCTGADITFPGNKQVFSGTGAVTGLKEALPEWFATPGTTDMTEAILKASDCAKASKGTLVLSGTYAVTKVRLYDAIDYSIRSENATLAAFSPTAQTAVLEIDNAVNFRMYGPLTILGHTTYAAGLRLITSAGSTIDPNGDITRVNIRDITFRGSALALSIGQYNVDAQLSEIVFNNLEMIGIPAAVYVAGSQTGASFVGCNLISEKNPTYYPGANEYILKMEGGFITIVGGQYVQANPTVGTPRTSTIINPASSATYSNPYPTLRITSTHIEVGGDTKLFEISNPRALPTPLSNMLSHIVFTASGGFVGASPTTIVGSILDATYAGRVQFKNNTFYTSGAVRTAATINSASSATIIDVDKSSFGGGYYSWLKGINGGTMLHEMINGVYADNLSAQTIGTGATATLKYATSVTTGEYTRYSPGYNASTGVFTVPAGGLGYVSVKASANTATGAPAAVAVYKNGAVDVYGAVVGTVMNAASDYYNLAAGDTLEIRVINSGGAALTFGAVTSDRITISMQN